MKKSKIKLSCILAAMVLSTACLLSSCEGDLEPVEKKPGIQTGGEAQQNDDSQPGGEQETKPKSGKIENGGADTDDSWGELHPLN